MSKEYIEREAAIAFLENMAASRYLIQCFESKEKFPAADVVEVRHGEWRYGDKYKTCSLCSATTPICSSGTAYWNYCPNCGAEMNGKGD